MGLDAEGKVSTAELIADIVALRIYMIRWIIGAFAFNLLHTIVIVGAEPMLRAK